MTCKRRNLNFAIVKRQSSFKTIFQLHSNSVYENKVKSSLVSFPCGARISSQLLLLASSIRLKWNEPFKCQSMCQKQRCTWRLNLIMFPSINRRRKQQTKIAHINSSISIFHDDKTLTFESRNDPIKEEKSWIKEKCHEHVRLYVVVVNSDSNTRNEHFSISPSILRSQFLLAQERKFFCSHPNTFLRNLTTEFTSLWWGAEF